MREIREGPHMSESKEVDKKRQAALLTALPVAIVLAVVIAIAGGIAVILYPSQRFIENYVLLLATAGITGFSVPYVLKFIDDKLSRQNKVIDAQVQFLESISKLLWEFHALIARVSYYKKMGQEND